MNIETIKYQLKNQIDPESTVFAAFEHIESYELKFWLANMTLEYITFLETMSEKMYENILDEELELAKMASFIKVTFKEAAQVLEQTPQEIQDTLQICKSYKTSLHQRLFTLTAYGEKVKLMEYIFNRIEGRFGAYDELQVDREDFTNRLMRYIIEDEEPMVMQDKIKAIYGQLPVRLTKQKFFDWIEQSLLMLRGVRTSEFDDYCKMLEDVFHPEGVHGYGEYFSFLVEQMPKLDIAYSDAITEDEVELGFERIRAISLYIDNAITMSLQLVTMLNGLMAILLSLTEKSLKENQQEIKDFVEMIVLLSSREGMNELIDEEVLSRLEAIEGVMEDSLSQHMVLDNLIDTLDNNYQDEVKDYRLSQRLKNIRLLKDLGSSSFFAPDADEESMDDQVDDNIVNDKMKHLQEVFTKVMAEGNRLTQRGRMGLLLGTINVTHRHTDEIREYISFALNQCNDESELKACVFLLQEEIMGDTY